MLGEWSRFVFVHTCKSILIQILRFHWMMKTLVCFNISVKPDRIPGDINNVFHHPAKA